ncbi:hypothetical protein [Paracoccus laeviglucosivorans]|nr:hypothetical protein [Paracoccus laeviglucosivorans]
MATSAVVKNLAIVNTLAVPLLPINLAQISGLVSQPFYGQSQARNGCELPLRARRKTHSARGMYSDTLTDLFLAAIAVCVLAILGTGLILLWRGQLAPSGKRLVRHILIGMVFVLVLAAVRFGFTHPDRSIGIPARPLR